MKKLCSRTKERGKGTTFVGFKEDFLARSSGFVVDLRTASNDAFLKRDLTLEGFSLIDFKNPSFEQIWADAVNIVPEDFDPLTWLLTFLTFDVAIVVVIVMDGKSRIKGTIELFPRHPSALPSLYCFSRVCSLPALWIGMVLSSVWSLSCSSRFGHASWRMPVEFLPRKSESHS